jgi:hypothetical protein
MSDSIPIGESYFLLSTSTWRDFVTHLPRPAFSLGADALYRVDLRGSGFAFSIEGSNRSVVGFFTTCFVAAQDICQAETKARSSVLREWRRGGFEAHSGLTPVIDIEESGPIRSRFCLRSGEGFTFFCESELQTSGS